MAIASVKMNELSEIDWKNSILHKKKFKAAYQLENEKDKIQLK